MHRPEDQHGNADGLSRQCSVTPELTEAERPDLFGSCPPVNSLEDVLGRINLVVAEDTKDSMSIQFQEDGNFLRVAKKTIHAYVSSCNRITPRIIHIQIY